jgi:hypothetical protein
MQQEEPVALEELELQVSLDLPVSLEVRGVSQVFYMLEALLEVIPSLLLEVIIQQVLLQEQLALEARLVQEEQEGLVH